MYKPTQKEIDAILKKHDLWLRGKKTGIRADLSSADLSWANLRWANLSWANLSSADLSSADLRWADLRWANLRSANLRSANLRSADLSSADLSSADLSSADLRSADLRWADLRWANLSSADLQKLISIRTILPEGDLIGYKKLRDGVVCKIQIPSDARRVGGLIGRKCRAEYAIVLEGEGTSQHDSNFTYKVGDTIKPDSYDENPMEECSNGVHFFITKEEAEAY
jgi:hypothetical protein